MIIVNNFTRSRINVGKIESKTSKILKLLGVFLAKRGFLSAGRQTLFGEGFLEINILPPLKMAELHGKLLKKSGPTTVISVESGGKFPVGELFSLGEIYLCPQEIEKSGLGLEYFLVHGILHLYGYDHKTNKGEAAMLEKEKQICAKIGL